MNPVIVIPTYWSGDTASLNSPGAYDHTTAPDTSAPELDRCLASLEEVRRLPRVVVLLVCPQGASSSVEKRVRAVLDRHPSIDTLLICDRHASAIMDRVSQLAPKAEGETISLRGYGAIRNMGLAVAAILGHDAVVFLDDDEVVLAPDFMDKALYALGAETRQGLPILAKSGYFYNAQGSPLADTTKKMGLGSRWWTKRIEFNRWMSRALKATRIRLMGMDVWFDNTWVVKHLPPRQVEESSRFMQNVYRWYYERTKLQYAARRPDLNPVTAASLMPYPGPWISSDLDERVRKTAAARSVLTREHAGYRHILHHGIDEAQRYAREHANSYLRFQSFWPSIMDGLWNDAELRACLEKE